LTGTVNNTALAQAQSTGDPETDRRLYELSVGAYISCVNAQLAFNDFLAAFGQGPVADPDDCDAPPEPPKPVQPLNCNELQSCPTSAPVSPPKDPGRLECGYEPYNCPLKTMCYGKRCEVVDCGMGTCPICPPGGGIFCG
jgi:hypothetical protein